MRSRTFCTTGVAVGFALLLAACSYHTQTTSGSRYLSKFTDVSPAPVWVDPDSGGTAPAASGTATAGSIDPEIAAAAKVEPTLTFPARIGLARIDGGRLASMPADEAAAWQEMAKRLGPSWGEFVPVSPLIAALANPGIDESACRHGWHDPYRYGGHPVTAGFECVRETVKTIRLGAARQHLDVVLIYESFGKSSDSSNPLAITKLALIGFFFPTEDVEAEGMAQAILVDVRNGYHYGTATAVAEKPVLTHASVGNVHVAHAEVQDRAKTAAVGALIEDVEKMAIDLRRDLESRHVKRLYR